MRLTTLLAGTAALCAMLTAPSVQAASLHLYCNGSTACSDDGGKSQFAVVSTGGPPTFTVDEASGPDTGTLLMVVLVPTNLPNPATQAMTLLSSTAGPSNTSSVTMPLNLFSTTAWTAGDLDTYLHISASPTNPINNYEGADSADPNGTPGGFYVYTASVLNTKVSSNGAGSAGDPQFSFAAGTGVTEPQVGDYILGFLGGPDDRDRRVATANSETLLVDSACTNTSLCGITPDPVADAPEPMSLTLFGTGLLGLVLVGLHHRAA